jgi:hypothetical protein
MTEKLLLLIFGVLFCIFLAMVEDIRESRKHGRDIALYVSGDVSDEQADRIAQRIAGSVHDALNKGAE